MLSTDQLMKLGEVATNHQSEKLAWAMNNEKNTGAIPPATKHLLEAW
jgi:hypothetical protein